VLNSVLNSARAALRPAPIFPPARFALAPRGLILRDGGTFCDLHGPCPAHDMREENLTILILIPYNLPLFADPSIRPATSHTDKSYHNLGQATLPREARSRAQTYRNRHHCRET
jgi:hypothetical protein